MSAWPTSKKTQSMGYYTQQELGFQFALADAFTLCDAYHCSFHGGTNTNRLFHWTGTNDPFGKNGGPVIDNSGDSLDATGINYTWTTYPERLQAAGVTWKVYQNMPDNFTDNPLAGFQQYRAANAARGNAANGSPYPPTRGGRRRQPAVQGHRQHHARRRLPAGTARRRRRRHAAAGVVDRRARHLFGAPGAVQPGAGRVVHAAGAGRADRQSRRLEPHGPADQLRRERRLLRPRAAAVRPRAGQHRQARRLHVDGCIAEYYSVDKTPFGPGPRVPMYVVSPWSRGGWVNSQVFDHTSVLRFLEQRFGVAETNISAYRRAIMGDLIRPSTSSTRIATPRWPSRR
jgi:phospholipase C